MMNRNIITILGILVIIIAIVFGVRFIRQSAAPVAQENENLYPIQGMEYGEWVESPVTSQGIQFMYPETLPTKYVTAQTWPPRVELVANEFECKEGMITATDGLLTKLEKRTFEDRVYCVAISADAAAGSKYTNYEYSTDQGDFVARIFFTLRTVQCLNYDGQNQIDCTAEQSSFDVDGLVDGIAQSIRML